MWNDSIVDEIHKIRCEHAEKFDYNLYDIYDDIKRQEKESGRHFVSPPIKRRSFPVHQNQGLSPKDFYAV